MADGEKQLADGGEEEEALRGSSGRILDRSSLLCIWWSGFSGESEAIVG